MTNSGTGGLRGAQLPRVSSLPPAARHDSGDDAIALAKSAGLVLDPWQQHVVRGALAETDEREWAANEVGLIVPRQNGKGSILEAVELAYLFLFGAELVVHSAHELRTAKVAYRRIRDLIEKTPHLASQVQQWRQSNEDVSLELKSGAFLRFVTRTSGTTRGFTADAIILDESYSLSADALAALLPTTLTKPNAQYWYVSTAGMESSEVLAAVRERGQTNGPGLAYFEWSAEDDADLDDRAVWAQANPGLGMDGHGVGEKALATLRGALTEDAFARECLGIWHDPRTEAVIGAKLWADLADVESSPVDPVAFSVDVAVDRKTASVAVAGRRDDGLYHVEVPHNRVGTRWVVDELVRMVERWKPVAVVLDVSGPAGSLLPDLEAAGVTVTKTSTREMAQACGLFYDVVYDRRLRHLNGIALNTALGSSRTRPAGDAWVWHRKDSTTDLTPLVAVTLALYGLLTAKPVAAKPRTGKVWA